MRPQGPRHTHTNAYQLSFRGANVGMSSCFWGRGVSLNHLVMGGATTHVRTGPERNGPGHVRGSGGIGQRDPRMDSEQGWPPDIP